MTPEQLEREIKRLRKLICCNKTYFLTTDEILAITVAPLGQWAFSTDDKRYYFWDGTGWALVTSVV